MKYMDIIPPKTAVEILFANVEHHKNTLLSHTGKKIKVKQG